MKRLCIFCGSRDGRNPVYLDSAREMGRCLAQASYELVYGGGSVGLMGAVADAVLAANGRVTGVIPKHLFSKEIAHAGLTDLRIVGSMHERKALMADLSDGFIAMPGGLGTFEEVCEILTWSQLGLHQKSVGILNVNSYYTPFLHFIDQAVQEGFIEPQHRQLFVVAEKPADLLDLMRTHRLPARAGYLKSTEET